ncbi:MAG TPA: nucleotide exchange factor GrpE [Acidimicrobiales bacterium]|nr:nucleotide exchange factor GrpE [Acidimicrobiales bacterium]
MSGTETGSESAPWPGFAGPHGADPEPDATAAPPDVAAEEADVRVPEPEADPLVRERDEYRDALQRLQADFENYRKRVAKQSDEVRERAAETLVTQLLPVLDTADLALSHGAGEDVKQLSASLFAALEKEGLERIDRAGDAFDPAHHDAVAHEPADDAGGPEVAEVMRAGYRWRGRVIRPAMVKVRG